MKKILVSAITLILCVLLLQSNIYAAEDWDTFYQRFLNATTANGKMSDLTDADLTRMAAGPTKEERLVSIFIDPDALSGMQEKARGEKESREIKKNNPQLEQLPKENPTNKEKKEEAQKLYKEISTNLSKEDISKMSTERLKEYLNKINEYKIVSGEDNLDVTLMTYWSQLNSALKGKGEKEDSTIIDSQVNNKGETPAKQQNQNQKQDIGDTKSTIVTSSFAPSELTKDDYGTAFDMAGKIVTALTTVGLVVAVIGIVILGVKYMIGSVEQKANYKKTMIPYIVGCIFIFAISKIVSIIYNLASQL